MSLTFPPLAAQILRRNILALLLGLALVAIPNQTDAATTGCRGDPIIQLSNGMKIQLTIALNVDPASVTDVTYTVHVPVGTTATTIKIAQTAATLILASKEHVTVIADQPAKQYRTSTVATTTQTATATVTGTFTPGPTLTASGPNGTVIPINYTAP